MRLHKESSMAYKNIVLWVINVLFMSSLSLSAYAEAFYGQSSDEQSSDKKSKQESRMDLAYDAAQKGLRHSDKFPGFANICDIKSPLRDMSAKRSAHSKERRKNANHKPLRSHDSKRKGQSKKTSLPPTQIFENVYFVGAGNVSSWAVDTGESIVLIDALNNEAQAQQYIIDGLAALGLGSKPISHLIITHGHGDHYGGQSLISKLYSPKIIMSNHEWNWLAAGADGFSSPRWGEAPVRKVGVSIGVDDETTLNIGNNTFTFYLTPGHTPGTLSVMFNAVEKDDANDGATHKAILWGGTGLNYGPDVERIKAYTQSAAKMRRLALVENIDVFLSNHPKRDGSDKKFAEINKSAIAIDSAENAENNPFVVGKETVMSAFDMLYHCTTAQMIKAGG